MTEKKGIPILIYAACTAIVLSVIRFFQYVTIMDFDTGFFKFGTNAEQLALGVPMILAMIGFPVICLIGRKRGWTAFTIASDGLGDKTTIVVGAAYFAAAVMQALDLLTPDAKVENIITALVNTGVFIATALLLFKNKTSPRAAGYIQVFSALCMFMRSVTLFFSDFVINSRSDSLIVLLAYVFSAVFFKASARCFARLEQKNSRPHEIVYAGIAFMFSAVDLLPKLMAYMFAGNSVLGMPPPDKTTVCVFIITGAFLCMLCLTKQRKEIEYIVIEEDKKDKEPEESEAEAEAD